MKTLCIVRHAKSSWKAEGLNDEMRPLNRRGTLSAPLMGRVLAKRGFRPDRILSSSARRARDTAALMAPVLGCEAGDIEIDSRIYLASVDELFRIVSDTPPEVQNLMLVGHNPGLHVLATLLGGFSEENLPTAAAVCIDFDVAEWREIEDAKGTIRFYEYPRRHDG